MFVCVCSTEHSERTGEWHQGHVLHVHAGDAVKGNHWHSDSARSTNGTSYAAATHDTASCGWWRPHAGWYAASPPAADEAASPARDHSPAPSST